MEKHWVVSNFNTIPNYYLEKYENLTVYDQSNDHSILQNLQNLEDRRIRFEGESCGHNLLNYLDWIIENYDELPDLVVFTKGNMPGRHCDETWFERATSSNLYEFLWDDAHLKDREYVEYRLAPGRYLEINNSWYAKSAPHRYFVNFDDFCNFLFANYRSPRFLLFSPGACYQVERERITRNPKSFYQGLRKIVEYDFRPAECFMLERALHLIFDGTLDLRAHCKSLDEFIVAINHLQDRSMLKTLKKKTRKERLLEALIYHLDKHRRGLSEKRTKII